MIQQHETCHKENTLPVPTISWSIATKTIISEKKLNILYNSEVVLASYVYVCEFSNVLLYSTYHLHFFIIVEVNGCTNVPTGSASGRTQACTSYH